MRASLVISFVAMAAVGCKLGSSSSSSGSKGGGSPALGSSADAQTAPTSGAAATLTPCGASSLRLDDGQLAAVQAIVAPKCAGSGCHAAGGTAPDLSSADAITAAQAQIVASIQAGVTPPMPPATSPQLAAADVSTIQAWGGGASGGSSGSAVVAAASGGGATATAAPCAGAGDDGSTPSGSAVGTTGTGTDDGGDGTSGGAVTANVTPATGSAAVLTGPVTTADGVETVGGSINPAPVSIPTGASGIPPSIGVDPTLARTSAPNVITELYEEHATGTGYRTWTQQPRIVFVQGLGIYARTFWNGVLVQALQANAASMPPGAISVMEVYADAAATQFKGWYVLGKAAAGNDPGSWFTYQLTGTPGASGIPDLPYAPQAYGMGSSNCSSCHQTPAYPTYVIGAPF